MLSNITSSKAKPIQTNDSIMPSFLIFCILALSNTPFHMGKLVVLSCTFLYWFPMSFVCFSISC